MALYINSDNLIEMKDLQDQDGNALTGATVNATVYESDATTEVSGQSWPITLTDDGGGDYSGVLEDTMELTLYSGYWVKLEIDAGGAQDERWKFEVAERRGFDG